MKMIVVFLIIALFHCGVCSLADPANWIGLFAIDNSCNQDNCCCLTEQATSVQLNDTYLVVSANVSGRPCQAQLNGSTAIQVLIPTPKDKSGFQITTNFLGTNNRFTLSSDSQYIANVNLQYPECSGMGQRVDPNWLGSFIADDSCNRDQCCCLTDEIKISRLGTMQLIVSANVDGATCASHFNRSSSVEIPVPIPQDKHGFQLTTSFMGSINRFTLTYDTQYITYANLQAPLCSGMARRKRGPLLF